MSIHRVDADREGVSDLLALFPFMDQPKHILLPFGKDLAIVMLSDREGNTIDGVVDMGLR